MAALTSRTNALGYRPDVDGLRAIAVLFVIIFHINDHLLPGGYVGVDIFFVISGFLITRHIASDIEHGRFSLIKFYTRRVKRIAPAMLVVLAASLLAAYFFTVPEDFRDTAKAGLWSLASLANVYFWLFQDLGYFAANSRELPLLHLWSLGVEEQFYAIWPLLLIALYKRSPRFIGGLVIAAIASFAAGELLFADHPSFVYYMLPTRAGELLLGALVAILVLRDDMPRLPGLMAAVGMTLLIASAMLLSEDDTFPGLRAVPPTLGAALLIFAGRKANGISGVLSTSPLVWIGLISYSAYLWHWPLLAFYRYGYGVPGPLSGTVIFLLTITLAALSYRFVEQPARKATWTYSHIVIGQYLAPAAAIAAMIGAAVYFHRPNIALVSLRDGTKPAYRYAYVCQRQRLRTDDITDPRCVLGQSTGPKVLLWGDSNAAHYVGMLGEFAKAAGFAFRNVAIGSCPPLLSDPTPYVMKRRVADCKESLPVARRAVHEADVIFISASFTAYERRSADFMHSFFATVRQLKRERKPIVLIGKIPELTGYDRRCPEKALFVPHLTCVYPTAPPNRDVAKMNARLKAFATLEQIGFFDPTEYLCPNDRCSARKDDGTHIYYDSSHLTLSASWALGRRIVQQHGVPSPFVAAIHAGSH